MNAQDLSNEILTDIEKEKVIAFAKDKFLFEAVKKYVLAVAYKHGIVESGKDYKGTINFALNLVWPSTQSGGTPRTDEELGQSLRALTYATQLVESGFKEIAEMEVPEVLEENTKNEAE